MKKTIFTLFLCGLAYMGFGQAAALRVAANGNVGIGMSTPEKSLDINGDARAIGLIAKKTGSSASALFNRTDGAAMSMGGGFQQSTVTFDQAYLYEIRRASRANVQNRILNAGTSAFTIRGSDGFVGINENSPTHLLTVNGQASKDGGGDWIATSDRRLKKDINKFEGGLKEVLALNPVTFKYNGKGGTSDNNKEYVGLVAQEVKEIAPYMVENFRHSEVKETRGPDGGVQYSRGKESEWLALDATAVRYMLVNAVKEQHTMIEEKDSRIRDLERKLDQLEAKMEDLIDEIDVTISLDDNQSVESGSLGQNRPNPFNTETRIPYVIPAGVNSAHMDIIDVNGKLLKQIRLDGTNGAGIINLKADEVPSGFYSYRLIIDGEMLDTKKMIKSR